MPASRFQLAALPNPGALAEAVAPSLAVELHARERLLVVYLDTFDWRLADSGVRLTHERGPRGEVWRWVSEDGPVRVLPAEGLARFVTELPRGWLRDAAAPLVGVRALLPVGELDLRRRLLRVVDGDRNTVLRVWWEQLAPRGRRGRAARPPAFMVRFEPATDAAQPTAAVLQWLETLPGAVPAPLDDLELALASSGRGRGDYSSKLRLELATTEAAAPALRTILRHLLGTVRANLDGVIEDLDSEFLHDLRVAVRRARSVLGELDGVLDPDRAGPFAEELRWLGDATGPCRDLDVFLLELSELGDSLHPEAAAALAPFADAMRHERREAREELVSSLRSRRCARALRSWSELCEEASTPETPAGERAIGAVADRRIRRAYDRVVRRGSSLGPSPPPEPLHRVRIAAKKLRYLLELFRSLYVTADVDALVSELKRLQDVLGGVQDTVVQLGRLEATAEGLHAERRAPAAALLAAGRLAARLEARQEALRAEFEERFASFAGDGTAAIVARLVAAPGGE
jgi:CHAD domain-containing protein